MQGNEALKSGVFGHIRLIFGSFCESRSGLGLCGWYEASFLGAMGCILLYTVFGLFFVRLHSHTIAAEMGLLNSFGMRALVRPDDPHLLLFGHQLGSALFFGMTLGVLNALVCMVLLLPVCLNGRFSRREIILGVLAVALCIFLTYSSELPLISVLCGVLSPAVFCLPAIWLIRKVNAPQVRLGRWIAFSCMIMAPIVLMLFSGPSFLSMRDAMLSSPITRTLSDFYYDHTLLAADVIKPIPARSQNVIAISDEIKHIGILPHGTLWIRTKDPCSICGATMKVSRTRADCRSIAVKDDLRPANDGNRIIEVRARGLDVNRQMRTSIGFFLFSGPMIVAVLLLFSWFALGLERLWQKSRPLTLILVFVYFSLFVPSFSSQYQKAQLRSHPEMVKEYASSPSEKMRYIAIVTYPGALEQGDLVRLMGDPSPGVRLNAMIEAGERAEYALLPLIVKALADPCLNVRTKACWALGRIGCEISMAMLDKTIRTDPSWYVRDYAYSAIGRYRPEARVVSLR